MSSSSKIIVSAFAAAAIGVAGLSLGAGTASADTYCGTSSRGALVYAGNAQTSCGFALSVAEAYHSYGSGTQPFTASSPTTGQSYTMTCTGAGSVCQGGNGAVVYLRR